MMKYFAVGKGMLAVALFAAGMALPACKDKDKEKTPKEGEETVAVATPMVRTVTLTQSFPGTLQAEKQIDIVARVDGVLKVHAQSGSHVKKGDLLYTIENAKYADAVKQAKSNIASYQAQYEYNKGLYEARLKAYQDDAASLIEVNQAKSSMEQNKAEMENAQAALHEAQEMLGYCSIRAPFDGTVGLQAYDQDAYINGEASPVKLNTLSNDDVLYAYISVDEKKYMQMMSQLEKKEVSLDSVTVEFQVPLQHRYSSKINYMAPEVSTTTGTVTMRFDLDNRYGELKSGMYANVVFPYQMDSDALLIRDASIGTDQQGKYVYLVNDSNKVVYTPIKVGQLYEDTLRIVTEGLTPESRYVTSALLKVRNGMPVTPIGVTDKSKK